MRAQMGSTGAVPAEGRSVAFVPTTLALPVTITSAMLTYFVFMLQKCLERRKDRAAPSGRISDQPQRARLSPTHTGCFQLTQSIGMGAENAPSHRQKARPSVAKEETMAAQSYDRLEGVIWYDGKLVPWNEANLHVLSHGLHYASCVFEGERAYAGKIFKSTEHSERLKRSADILDFEIPYSVAEIDAAKKLVVDKNGKKEAYVRPVAWRGSEMMGVSAQNNTIHLAIASWEWPSYFDPEQRLKGIKLDLAEYRRPDPKTAPCRAKAAGLYMICTISKHKAERKGYADAMMLDWEGRVAECTGANIFFIKDGKIHTPIADCFLDGITRQTVIGLARKHGFELIERRIMPDELTEFSECFITGSAAEVTAVAEIAHWNFNPGGITKTLMDDYTAEVNPKAAAA